jgi:hypothetical protein
MKLGALDMVMIDKAAKKLVRDSQSVSQGKQMTPVGMGTKKKVKTTTCCFCKREFPGEANFCVPEGFANNPKHDGKPLCDGCGSQATPTLEAICQLLDAEELAKSVRSTTPP